MKGCSAQQGSAYTAVISDKDFQRLSEFVHSQCGIRIPPTKRVMLEGRLRKRIRTLGMDSFSRYCEYLFSSEGLQAECLHMIDVVTTNKTDFFREPAHFDFLYGIVLPESLRSRSLMVRGKLNVWSAASSSGEEPYTLAVVLSEYAERNSSFQFSILGTDISTRVLEKARRGVYEEERIEPVPTALRRKYFLKSKDRSKGLVRVAPELRSLVKFQRLNLMDDDYGLREPQSVIFCRNVLIYFDRQTQEKVLKRLCRNLVPGGFLFTGHSETLQGMDLPLENLASTVYRKL